MPTASEAIDTSIREVTTARALVSKMKGTQVKGVDAIAALKATALAWFNSHRPIVVASGFDLNLAAADRLYTSILNATAKYAARQTYLDALQAAKNALIALCERCLLCRRQRRVTAQITSRPDFSPLAGNQDMRDILTRRWHECYKCVKADAHLAAIVMMGGLLEALFVARANRMPVKDPLINASSAPTDKASGKTLNYQEWMLDSYIRVGHELKWITESAKDVADILKEYRNYVHPEKDAGMASCWP